MNTTLTVFDGWNLDVSNADEPRARDVDIAKRAGMTRPRDVRALIERNWDLLTPHGEIGVCGFKSQTSGGRPGTEYWLNEAQSVSLVSIMKTPAARALHSTMVRLFVAYRRGQLAAAPAPLSLDVAHGPRVGDVPNLRADISALCAVVAKASRCSLRQVHGFVRRTYRVPGIHHVAVLAWPAVKATLEALGLGKIHLATPRLLPPRNPRQVAMPWGPS